MSAQALRAGAVLTVDLDAIVANWRFLSDMATPAECAAVVKADAYGLGAAEIAAEELRVAVRALDSLVGRVDVENVLDEIFASFCLGK